LRFAFARIVGAVLERMMKLFSVRLNDGWSSFFLPTPLWVPPVAFPASSRFDAGRHHTDLNRT
jgi:hypothetical protein